MGKGAGEGVGSTVAHESIGQLTAELENVKIGATSRVARILSMLLFNYAVAHCPTSSTALTRISAAAVPQATGPPAAPEVKAAKSILDRVTGPDAAAREAAGTELDSFVQKTGNIKHLEVCSLCLELFSLLLSLKNIPAELLYWQSL